MIRCALFDLDGTLLPQALDELFIPYFESLGRHFKDMAEPRKLVGLIVEGANRIIASEEPSSYNIDIFYSVLEAGLQLSRERFEPMFDAFYETDFDALGANVQPEPLISRAVDLLKSRSIKLALATNPMFPLNAVEMRVRWAGLDPGDFSLITHAGNMKSAKPQRRYYEDIARAVGCACEECVMVGNNVAEDMVAAETGMEVFWLKPYGICEAGAEPDCPQGGYVELLDFLDRITMA